MNPEYYYQAVQVEYTNSAGIANFTLNPNSNYTAIAWSKTTYNHANFTTNSLGEASELAKNVFVLAVTLLVLAVLNTYLLPHEHICRYPDSNMGFAYDEKFSLVKRFSRILDLTTKCLELATRPD